METNPKKMQFWTQQLVPVEGKIEALPHGVKFEAFSVETCRTVFPKFDLGQWREIEGRNCFVYATIERDGRAECRGLHYTSRCRWDRMRLVCDNYLAFKTEIGSTLDTSKFDLMVSELDRVSSARPYPLE